MKTLPTRAERRKRMEGKVRGAVDAVPERIDETAKKVASLLAESKASYQEVPQIFRRTERYLSVCFFRGKL